MIEFIKTQMELLKLGLNTVPKEKIERLANIYLGGRR